MWKITFVFALHISDFCDITRDSDFHDYSCTIF